MAERTVTFKGAVTNWQVNDDDGSTCRRYFESARFNSLVIGITVKKRDTHCLSDCKSAFTRSILFCCYDVQADWKGAGCRCSQGIIHHSVLIVFSFVGIFCVISPHNTRKSGMLSCQLYTPAAICLCGTNPHMYMYVYVYIYTHTHTFFFSNSQG